MYKESSGKSNCCKHLLSRHPDIYDKTVQEKNWPYHLSTEASGTRATVSELRKRVLPWFTPESFIEYLVRFIVADDQVSNLFLVLNSNSFPHFFSQFTLSNVLNSATYVWSFAEAYKTAISPIKTKCGRLSSIDGTGGLRTWSKS